MTEDFAPSEYLENPEEVALRNQALDLFERCLAEGNAQTYVQFVHQQIDNHPARIDLLYDFAEDLHQRLMALRQSQFDVRKHTLHTVMESYNIDLSQIAPPQRLAEYHLLRIDHLTSYLRQHHRKLPSRDVAALCKVVKASLVIAEGLQGDVQLTRSLLDYVTDWAEALNLAQIHDNWLPPLKHGSQFDTIQ